MDSRPETFVQVVLDPTTKLGFAFRCEGEPVLDAAAAFKNVGVRRRGVSFAYYVGGSQLELGGERGGACPLDAVGDAVVS